MKRQFANKKLTYSFAVEPLLRNSDSSLSRDLQVTYRGELLPDPAMLTLEIVNTGLAAVENAEVVVKLPGTTYLIPGFFAEVPPGYESLWSIDRSDAEECTIRFAHINPKQVARVRLVMDEMPSGEPEFSCAMPNVAFVRASAVKIGALAQFVLKVAAPAAIELRLR